MDKKEEFKLVYDSLIDLYKEYTDNVMKTLFYITIAIGWILTSTSSRDFLSNPKGSPYYYLTLSGILAIAIIHTMASIGFYQRSQMKKLLLSEMNLVNSKSYEHYIIISLQMVINLVMNLVLFAILFVMIFSLRIKP